MEPPNRLLRVGLLIGAVVSVDMALGFVLPARFGDMQIPALLVGILFWGFTASQIAALSIWVALGGGGSAPTSAACIVRWLVLRGLVHRASRGGS